MKILLDTNILTRSSQWGHPQHQVAVEAVARVLQREDTLCLVPQVLYEFWTVATRPVGANGLNLSTAAAHAKVEELLATFELLHDGTGLIDEWLRIVLQHDVKGKQGHDARLVAAMRCHGVIALLTFNKSDFTRYPWLTVFSPEQL